MIWRPCTATAGGGNQPCPYLCGLCTYPCHGEGASPKRAGPRFRIRSSITPAPSSVSTSANVPPSIGAGMRQSMQILTQEWRHGISSDIRSSPSHPGLRVQPGGNACFSTARAAVKIYCDARVTVGFLCRGRSCIRTDRSSPSSWRGEAQPLSPISRRQKHPVCRPRTASSSGGAGRARRAATAGVDTGPRRRRAAADRGRARAQDRPTAHAHAHPDVQHGFFLLGDCSQQSGGKAVFG